MPSCSFSHWNVSSKLSPMDLPCTQPPIFETLGTCSILLLSLSGELKKLDYVSNYSSLISAVLEQFSTGTTDIKALRAFRVLRPLRLVSGVPSKSELYC